MNNDCVEFVKYWRSILVTHVRSQIQSWLESDVLTLLFQGVRTTESMNRSH